MAWEQSQAQGEQDRRQIVGAGLSGLAAACADPPSLSADALIVRHAWRWCGGWAPERLPLYLLLHPFDDSMLLMELLQYLRDRLAVKDSAA